MKKIFISALLLIACIAAKAQEHPTGQILVKDQKTDVLYKDIKAARIQLTSAVSRVPSKATISHIDNSKLKYFPPIINQVAGSCAYASGVGYIYSYEYNLANDLDGRKAENIINYLQVYAQLNGGEDVGGHAQNGWKFIKDNGAPMKVGYGTRTLTEWASGYNVYYNGMDRGTADISQFVSDDEGAIDKMKQYLIDHGNGSTHGGLIQFSAYADPFDPTRYTGPSETGYDAIIPKFGTDGMHSMTIVGFDDAVEYDYNGFTKKGAFICVNSWGESWGDSQGCNSDGRFYAPYYTFTTLRQGNGGTGNGGKACLIVDTKNTSRDLVAQLVIDHDSRNDLEITVGLATTKGATRPTKTLAKQFMKHQGGDFPMTGKTFGSKNVLEFAVNMSDLLSDNANATYFVTIRDLSVGASGKGEVLSCTLTNYVNNTKYVAVANNTELKNGKVCTYAFETAALELVEGVDSNVRSIVDSYDKKLYVYLNNTAELDTQIDLIRKGKISKELFSGKTDAGSITKIIDLKDVRSDSYQLRIISGNNFIYKNITIK